MGGLAHLKEGSSAPRERVLHAYRGTLEAYLLAHPPATVAEASATITALTGIERGPTQVRQFLHALGMKPRTVGTIPAQVDVAAQEAFKKKGWSRAEPKPKPASAWSYSWMPRTLSTEHCWGCAGVCSGCVSKPHRVVNA
jgi:hypothetical protein